MLLARPPSFFFEIIPYLYAGLPDNHMHLADFVRYYIDPGFYKAQYPGFRRIFY